MKATITICMGSSCFSRGNRENLAVLNAYLDRRGMAARVNLVGCRCEGQCTKGPAIRIDDRLFVGVDRGMLIDLLNQYLGNRKEGAHGSSLPGLYGRERVQGVPHVPSPLSGQGDRLQGGAGCCHP